MRIVGSEAVDWLVKCTNIKNREEAVRLGQDMIDTNVIERVAEKNEFIDGNFFYRFKVALIKLIQIIAGQSTCITVTGSRVCEFFFFQTDQIHRKQSSNPQSPNVRSPILTNSTGECNCNC